MATKTAPEEAGTPIFDQLVAELIKEKNRPNPVKVAETIAKKKK